MLRQDRDMATLKAIVDSMKPAVPFIFAVWSVSRDTEPVFAKGVLATLPRVGTASLAAEIVKQVEDIAAKAVEHA